MKHDVKLVMSVAGIWEAHPEAKFEEGVADTMLEVLTGVTEALEKAKSQLAQETCSNKLAIRYYRNEYWKQSKYVLNLEQELAAIKNSKPKNS